MNDSLPISTDSPQNIPLCVDLDGTLTGADLTVESLLCAVRRQPWTLFKLPAWLLKGKSYLKAQLANRALPDVTVLPFNSLVVQMVNRARQEGRRTVLITGSNIRIAKQVQSYLGAFDEVLGSDNTSNLTGRRKARVLTDRFGSAGYEYVGNSHTDIPVWASAAAIVTVNAPVWVVKRAAALRKPHQNIPPERGNVVLWLRAIRIHQWAKNILVFVPMLLAHQMLDARALLATALAFLCFGLCASATYIVNDLSDLDSDRNHRTKRCRPFAAGLLSIASGAVAAVGMTASGLLLAALLPVNFQIALSVYIATTLFYSFRLKRVASLDVVVLAGLYTLRIVAGAIAAAVLLSFWLLAFSLFMFLCLAIVKRVAELLELDRDDDNEIAAATRAQGREYSTADLPVLQTLGACSGYVSVLVLALYINSPEVLLMYRTPQLLWLIAPLMLLWVTRLWIVTSRGYMNDDPIVFAIKDPETWLTGTVVGVIILLAAAVDLGNRIY